MPQPGHPAEGIRSTTETAHPDVRSRTLKHGETFAVFNAYGDIEPAAGVQGIYHEGTRFLSLWRLTIADRRPLYLSSTVREDNAILTVDLMNPELPGGTIARGQLHIFRAQLLWQGVYYERIRITHYGLHPVRFSLALQFDADFRDVFEVRGHTRAHRGTLFPTHVDDTTVTFGYRGRDGRIRRTWITWDPAPQELSAHAARFEIELHPRMVWTGDVTVACCLDDTVPERLAFGDAWMAAESRIRRARMGECDVYTSNEQFNDWINRSISDLHMLITETPEGWYPYAGIPWYGTVFGRDGLITALEMLWINPSVARGVLAFLAATQADSDRPEQDAEPGKILHELRRGEMAATGEIPFRQYYGSVDATPLFVILADAYVTHTGDRDFIRRIWPAIVRAMDWLTTYGDPDADGFIEYRSRASNGLANQGWKDSWDAVFHADGTLAEGPIALCEVQGYAYAAFHGAARIARILGHGQQAQRWEQRGKRLQRRFIRTFWDNDLQTCVLALDGRKRPCRVRTSNAGQCLWTGIVHARHARRIADLLTSPVFFSGWGIRTVATTEARYNPMSYHNGSVWPHDNALIAWGFARYRLKAHVLKVLTGMFDAAIFMDLHRLPELFCGFDRRPGEGPTLYPVACNPQAWAAAAVFLLLRAALGLTIDGATHRVIFDYPVLPPFLQEVYLRHLRVGTGSVDLLLRRHDDDVTVRVLHREGPLEITIIK